MGTRWQGCRRGCLCGIPAYCLSSRQGLPTSRPAAQSPQAVSAKPYAHGPSLQLMCVVRNVWMLRATHMEQVRLARHHRSRRQTSTDLLELAGDAVPVPIQPSRYPDRPDARGCTQLPPSAVRKVRASCFGSSAGAGAAAPPLACVALVSARAPASQLAQET